MPVFDEHSEELFGFVMIETSLDRLIGNEIRDRFRATKRMFVLDNDCHILLHITHDQGRVYEHDGKPMNAVSECWSNVLPLLKDNGEFIDEQDHAVYATRIDLVPGRYSLALAMCLTEN